MIMLKSIINCAVILFLLSACQSVAIYTAETRVQRPLPREQEPRAQSENRQRSTENTGQRSDTRGQRTEHMVASWYGNQFHGRQTASGEIFNMYDYTAAHRTLPFGTRLRLINETNNKEAVVRINDRGPVPLERDLDVSFKAAQALDFVGTGTIRLRVVFLD